jgi:hypothetical protein
MPKISRAGATNDAAENEQGPAKSPADYLRRIGKLAPEAESTDEDEGSDFESVGMDSSASSKSKPRQSDSRGIRHQVPAQTTENHSEAPEEETDSSAPTMDGDGQQETQRPSGSTHPRKSTPVKKAARKASVRSTDDEFNEFD